MVSNKIFISVAFMGNMTGATTPAGIVYPSGTHRVTPGF